MKGTGHSYKAIVTTKKRSIVEAQVVNDEGADDNSKLGHQSQRHIGDDAFQRSILIGCWRDGPTSQDVSRTEYCVGCDRRKMCNRPFKPIETTPDEHRLQLIHMDVGGPFPVESFGRPVYIFTFIENYS